MRHFFRSLILGIIGGVTYCGIELVWRLIRTGHAYTHWTMGVVGGVCFIICGSLNEFYKWKTPVFDQMFISTIIITTAELIAGLFLNCYLNLNIWDYSNLPLNFMGQICLPFSLAWFGLSLPIILLDDWLRWRLFGEDKPHYEWRFLKNYNKCGK